MCSKFWSLIASNTSPTFNSGWPGDGLISIMRTPSSVDFTFKPDLPFTMRKFTVICLPTLVTSGVSGGMLGVAERGRSGYSSEGRSTEVSFTFTRALSCLAECWRSSVVVGNCSAFMGLPEEGPGITSCFESTPAPSGFPP